MLLRPRYVEVLSVFLPKSRCNLLRLVVRIENGKGRECGLTGRKMKGRPVMSNMRYRKPSPKTLLGVTKLKKRAKKALGINKLLWPFRAVGNYQRRVLRRAGYYRPEMKMMRAMQRGQVAGPVGPLQVGERGKDGEHSDKGSPGSSLLMAAMLANGQHGDEEDKGQKKGGHDSPNLAEAMLLATALKGSQAEHAPKARHAAEELAPKAAHPHTPAAHVRQGDEAPAAAPRKRQRAQPEPAPKRHRGLRILGLVLTALLVAAAIVAVWYFWIV